MITIQYKVGSHVVRETRSRDGHVARLARLVELEAARKRCAPTYWGRVDDYYAAEAAAIQQTVK